MGIHQQWKLLLKEHYPQCFLTQYPEEKKLDVFAIDFLPFIFGKSQNINTGQHFMNYVFKVSLSPAEGSCLSHAIILWL